MSALDLRQHPVIVDVIPVVAWRLGQDQSLQPLNASSTNLTRYNNPQRTTVVRTKGLPVHRMGKHDSFIGIHNPVEFH